MLQSVCTSFMNKQTGVGYAERPLNADENYERDK